MTKTFTLTQQKIIEEKSEQLQRIANGSLSPRIKYAKYEKMIK